MTNEEIKKKEMFDINRKRTPGEIVSAQRRKLKISQEELSNLSDVSLSSIRRIENNERRTGLELIEKLEKTLGIPLREAFEEYWAPRTARRKKRPATGDALRGFMREMVSRNLSEAELQKILDSVLSKADSNTETQDGK